MHWNISHNECWRFYDVLDLAEVLNFKSKCFSFSGENIPYALKIKKDTIHF